MAAEKTRNKIPPDAESGILEQAGKGRSLREICDWLETTHGVRVSPNAIRKKLAKGRADREVIAKAVVRERIVKTVTSDIDQLDRDTRRLKRLATSLYKLALRKPLAEVGRTTTSQVYAAIVEQVRKLVDLKLHYSGADTPDDPLAQLADAERRVTGRLDRLAAARGESAAPAGDRANRRR